MRGQIPSQSPFTKGKGWGGDYFLDKLLMYEGGRVGKDNTGLGGSGKDYFS